MRFRSKLLILWTLTLLLPLAGMIWSLQWTLRASFERVASAGFAGTGQSLLSLQAQRVSQMRQAAALVMSIPELRALIAEQSTELSSDNLASLQERLDSLSKVVDVRFLCVMDGGGRVIAQNQDSPWQELGRLREFLAESPEATAMGRRLFSPGPGGGARGERVEQGLWVHERQIYEVVGVPLRFGGEDDAPVDGALLMGVPLSDTLAAMLGRSHDCLVSFVAQGRVVASNVPGEGRRELERTYVEEGWPLDRPFTLRMGRQVYHSTFEPLVDGASGRRVGGVLIQCSTAQADGVESKLWKTLTVIFCLGMLVALGTSYILSGAVTRPVQELVKGAKQVAAGDLKVRLPAKRKDELGELAVAFNDMVSGLRRQRELAELVRESQAASQAKSQFLANMSHEIRTPLHGVMGMSELLLKTELTQKQRRYVGLVRTSAEMLMTLINDILDFSKIEAGKLELEAIDFDLPELAGEVVELLGQRASAKGLKINRFVSPELPARLRGDSTRVRQVILNLVSNAIKFTERGSVSIRVGPEPMEGGVGVRVEVSDTGIGIPADRRDRLFRSFSQVDASMTRRFGGTGLGLAISRQLVELMGGRIGVESEEGKGSTFWFTMRLGTALAEAVKAAPAEARATRAQRAFRLLLAEDQEVNQIVAGEVLSDAGYQFDVVADGKSAVEALGRTEYDLVLMDCQMPVMDGFEATRAIRAGEKGRRIPIVALTANAAELDRERCMEAGMDGYCAKPFTARELLDAIEAQLPRSTPAARAVAETGEAAVDAGEPFNPTAVLDRCSGKRQLAAVVLEKFGRQVAEAIVELEKGVGGGNAAELARIAHAIKGSAGLVSAGALASAAARMEQIGRDGTLQEAGECLERISAEARRCAAYVEQVRNAFLSERTGAA